MNSTAGARASSQAYGDKARDTIEDMAGAAGEYASKAAEKAQGTLSSIAEQGRDAGERVNEVAGNMKSAVDQSLKTQPMATLAVAVVAGFVLGALWKS